MADSKPKESWEILAYRLKQWKTFPPAPICGLCRARNCTRNPKSPDIRVTPVGDACLSCWLDREVCEVCGVGAVAVGWSKDTALEFRGRHVCAECLVPEVSPVGWRDWLLYFVYTPQSSFVEVLNDCFAETLTPRSVARRAVRRVRPARWDSPRYSAAELVSAALDERMKSWALPSVRG